MAVGKVTFGYGRFTAEQVTNAFSGVISVGYKLFDGISVYSNEDLTGEVY
jgi:alcohol dehydrogenase (NADP+)